MRLKLLILSFSLGFVLTACSFSHPSFLTDKQDRNGQEVTLGHYTGSYDQGNYVWGGAMNLAWNDLGENILQGSPQLNTSDKAALEMAANFNQAKFSKSDLDEASYYIKSGYGQKTVDLINRESRQKFPNKSFGDLNIQLNDRDMIAYAYFVKQVEYLTQFKEKSVQFNNDKVKGFYAADIQQKHNVGIVKYWDDDKFIIKLRLKDDSDELFLAKGFDKVDPQSIVDQINSNKYPEAIDSSDVFSMPKLHLDYHRDYKEMEEKYLANPKFKDYMISQMFENIKFDMDQKGAKVENEAVIAVPLTAALPTEPKKAKYFVLDKPFWVIMKRTDSQNPYFILGVNNTKIMLQ